MNVSMLTFEGNLQVSRRVLLRKRSQVSLALPGATPGSIPCRPCSGGHLIGGSEYNIPLDLQKLNFRQMTFLVVDVVLVKTTIVTASQQDSSNRYEIEK